MSLRPSAFMSAAATELSEVEVAVDDDGSGESATCGPREHPQLVRLQLEEVIATVTAGTCGNRGRYDRDRPEPSTR